MKKQMVHSLIAIMIAGSIFLPGCSSASQTAESSAAVSTADTSPVQTEKPTTTTDENIVVNEKTESAAGIETSGNSNTIEDETAEGTTALSSNITAESNTDFANVLSAGDDYNLFSEFSQNYRGRNIEFDGYVAAVNPHENYTTRWDFLIDVADSEGNDSLHGPQFQFRDCGRADLHLSDDIEGLSAGDTIHVVATVGEFDPDTGLFQLQPVKISK